MVSMRLGLAIRKFLQELLDFHVVGQAINHVEAGKDSCMHSSWAATQSKDARLPCYLNAWWVLALPILLGPLHRLLRPCSRVVVGVVESRTQAVLGAGVPLRRNLLEASRSLGCDIHPIFYHLGIILVSPAGGSRQHFPKYKYDLWKHYIMASIIHPSNSFR